MCPDVDDRLSALPDSVLARVLSCLHLKAAVQTSVLSKRWRMLWREADVVTLDTREYRDIDYDGAKVGREFFRDALAAVGADGRCPVRRLKVRADSYFQNDFLQDIMRTSPGMDALLAAPAMRRLEEFRMKLTAEFCHTSEEYVLPPGLLPGMSLRVLDIRGCTLGSLGAGGGATVFGSLETLKMVDCVTSSEALQSMLDAAPNLSTLWIEYVGFPTGEDHVGLPWDTVMSMRRRILLRCPVATVSVTLMHCHCSYTDGVDLDAPGARTLRYAGFLENFPFSSAAPSGAPANLQHMELCFCTTRCTWMYPSRMDVANHHAIFWQSIGRFSQLRFLQVELRDINDIAVQPEEEDVFLKVFPDLRFLKLKGSYQEDSYGAAVAIANLLQCCPSMEEFCFKCDLPSEPYTFPGWVDPYTSNKVISRTITNSSSEEDDDDDADLAPLKAHSFHCLDHNLRKISFKFESSSFDCFEVKLAKFFVENAAVLEEMEVHDVAAVLEEMEVNDGAAVLDEMEVHDGAAVLEEMEVHDGAAVLEEMEVHDGASVLEEMDVHDGAAVLEEMEMHDRGQRVYDQINHKLAEWRANSSKTKIKIVGKHNKRF